MTTATTIAQGIVAVWVAVMALAALAVGLLVAVDALRGRTRPDPLPRADRRAYRPSSRGAPYRRTLFVGRIPSRNAERAEAAPWN